MYWENCTERVVLESKCNTRPIARKEHRCCECGKTIKKGERYSYLGGLCRDEYYYSQCFAMFKTCLKCEKVWDEILKILHDNRNTDAIRVYGLLEEAIEYAYDMGYLTEEDPLVNEWLDIWPEETLKDLSLEEKEIHEKKEAFVQMVAYSVPLL